jgi:hypothetical protein
MVRNDVPNTKKQDETSTTSSQTKTGESTASPTKTSSPGVGVSTKITPVKKAQYRKTKEVSLELD